MFDQDAMALRLLEVSVMKKKTDRKLILRTQTLRTLTEETLRGVVGGFIMKDTIIIRTGNPFVPGDVERP